MRVIVKTIGLAACSAPVASVAAIDTVELASLSAIEPVALAGAPSVYPEPAFSVSTTDSALSSVASSIGVTVTVAPVEPAASVSVKPFAESIPPVAETV